ncbi:MAG: microcin ABC transporter permease, partial [Paracoccaceae bacterium]|nr:microcin ABC transporter permease [Paracoccaceae bacterium]
MGAYILRRLLLVIPTLFGVMLINFALTQFVPGGPIDQIQARIQGEGDSIAALSGTSDAGTEDQDSGYVGARGLPPEFLAKLEVQFGFARIVCDEGFTGT